jgi:hypothetical protein
MIDGSDDAGRRGWRRYSSDEVKVRLIASPESSLGESRLEDPWILDPPPSGRISGRRRNQKAKDRLGVEGVESDIRMTPEAHRSHDARRRE